MDKMMNQTINRIEEKREHSQESLRLRNMGSFHIGGKKVNISGKEDSKRNNLCFFI